MLMPTFRLAKRLSTETSGGTVVQPCMQLAMQKFISELKVSEDVKKELQQITPFNFTGINQLK